MDKDIRLSGKNLKAELFRQGRRQDWIAANLGVAPATVNRWVNGSRLIDWTSAQRIADLLGADFYLLFDIPEGIEMIPSVEAA